MPRRLSITLITAAIALAATAGSAQALPPGVQCVAAKAENQLTPPPPPWMKKHEPESAVLPALCPPRTAPTAVARPADSPSAASLVPPVSTSPLGPPEGFSRLLTANIARPEGVKGYPTVPYYYAGDGPLHRNEILRAE
jgi:hypothetical protein